jgi:hypothetical protein
MSAVVATLQRATQQLQLSESLERSDYSRITAQLRVVTAQLTAAERRTAKKTPAPVYFTGMLRVAAAPGSPAAEPDACAREMLVPEGIKVEGPAHDLHDLISGLVEYARTVGGEPIELRAQVEEESGDAGAVCAMELVVRSPDLPDFLRRKLWEAARARRGRVTVISEPECCRIEFTLPIVRG